MPPSGPVDLSVIVPFYNERENLEELYRKVAAVLPSLKLSYEIILVDDGSSDGGYELLARLAPHHSRVKNISLSPNF